MKNAQDRLVSDVQLATFLRARGYRIKAVRPDGRRTEWLFEAVPEAEVLAYYNGDASICARNLFNAFREMKGHSYQRI